LLCCNHLAFFRLQSFRGGVAALRSLTTMKAVVSAASSAGGEEGTWAAATSSSGNPLLGDWSSRPFHLAPFEEIEPMHFPGALEEGMRAHLEDLSAIASEAEVPNFENTIAAYDRAGRLLERVSNVFSNLCSSQNTEDLQKVQTEMAPILSRHRSSCFRVPGLFDRIQQV